MRKYNPKVKCTATSKGTGQPCKRPAIAGGFVCRNHGGKAPQVVAKAQERLADLIDPDRALREAARLAYSDVRQLFDQNGKMLPIKQWPDGLAAAIGGVEVVRRNVDSNDDHTDDVIKIKVWDKPKNLELLFKHMGLLIERVNVNAAVTYKWEGEEG